MSASERQARRRQRRLDEITETAMRMITDDGIAAFSVNRLAEELALTPGALYRYFASREMILASVERRVLDEFARYFGRIEDRLATVSALERVAGFALGYAALEGLRPERFRLLSHFMSGDRQVLSDEVAAELVPPAMEILGRLAQALTGASEVGELDDADDAMQRTALLWAALHGIMERRKLARFAPETFDPDTLARQLVLGQLVGWGAEADRAADAVQRYVDRGIFEECLKEAAS